MDGIRDSHTKWTKSEKERQIQYDIWNLIYGTNKPIYGKQTNKQTNKKLMDMENRLVVAKVELVGWTGNLGLVDENCMWSG